MNVTKKKFLGSKGLTSIVAALLFAALSATTFTSCTHDEVRRGAWGAGGGAIVGGILGGGRGAAVGAIAGGLLGAGTSRSRYMGGGYGYYPPRPPMGHYGYYPY